MIDVLVPSKGWEWQSANLLAILWEVPHTSHNKYDGGQTFISVVHLTPKIKLIQFLNERDDISSLRFEDKFATHVTEDVRMI
jgi:hypothetical protein